MQNDFRITKCEITIPWKSYEAKFVESDVTILGAFSDKLEIQLFFNRIRCCTKPTPLSYPKDGEQIRAAKFSFFPIAEFEPVSLSMEQIDYIENEFVSTVNMKCKNSEVPFEILELKLTKVSNRVVKTATVVNSFLDKFRKK